MTIFLLLLSFLNLSWAIHYPEERTYTSEDKGYTQYGAPSLHQSGKYSLTFDDGPHPVYTAKILDVLKRHNVKATFFVITSNINEKTFPLIKRMLDEGHLVGSHGSKHDNSNRLTQEQWKTRVGLSFQDLKMWYAKAGRTLEKAFYRFPYAAYGERKDYNHLNALRELARSMTGDNCIQFAFWDIDSGDWIPGMDENEVFQNLKSSNESGPFITYKTVKNAQGHLTQIKVPTFLNAPTSGGVILQHDVHADSIQGTEKFLTYGKERGLEFVRLDEVDEFRVTKRCHFR